MYNKVTLDNDLSRLHREPGDSGKPKVARESLGNLVIAGVNKSATTSLYTYLSHHPDVCGSSIKETNYFLPVVLGGQLPPIESYAAYFQGGSERRYRMEASPRYIFGGGKLARAIRESLGSVRVVFVLRQPVDRLVSYFKHMRTSKELPAEMTCDDYAARAMQELPAARERAGGKSINVYGESVFTRGLAQGFYADYLEEWYSVFPDSIRVYFFEDVTRNPGTVMGDLCRWLEIDPAVYLNTEFTWENRSMRHKNQILFSIASFFNDRFEPFWRKHGRIKEWARGVYCRFNEDKEGDKQLSPQRCAELESVYHPFNQRLERMLSQRSYRNLPTWLSDAVR